MTKINTQTLVLASNNAGKIKEIQSLLPDFTVIPQSEFCREEVEETGLSFVENALLKARYMAARCDFPVIADDSGLSVDALQGAPGIYSARFARIGASDLENNDKLLTSLADVPFAERNARFVCAIVLLKHANDPVPLITQGVWEGKILMDPQGENGFGYDPLFWVPTHHCASAELSSEIKNSLSHRGQALRQLVGLLQAQSS